MERDKTNRWGFLGFFGTGLLLLRFGLTVIWKDFPWKQGKVRIQAQDSVSMAHVSIGLFIVLYLYDSLSVLLVSKCGERSTYRCCNWCSTLISDAFCGGSVCSLRLEANSYYLVLLGLTQTYVLSCCQRNCRSKYEKLYPLASTLTLLS